MSAHRLNPYPPHYRPAFASSAFLCPHPLQPSLRSACPLGRLDTGLPCSARITGRVRSCLSAGRVSVRAALSRQAGPPFSAPFWPEPKLSPDGSLKPNDVYQQFTYVDRTFQALLPDGVRLGRRHLTSRLGLAFRRATLSRQPSHLAVASHARVGRLPLAKQRVLSGQDSYSCDLTSHRRLILNYCR
jgi:hypothetical protein